ncbi:uncharacterized protein Tco025E_09396 [Trypanosoma conorhini]|uniref:Flagellar attachment zone protein 1 conserved domain-containing protein n=1 Tax=Trypanosoma conorhini TaxID=83891 RepID=A0A3R7KMQ8_9TRYP|nr:uncharacterized protein Tco025E_09396 [Trypanosoma conorhini]RNE97625.1 hypothetical protein Tco025E_09396 [Trypanosoma conorhini]
MNGSEGGTGRVRDGALRGDERGDLFDVSRREITIKAGEETSTGATTLNSEELVQMEDLDVDDIVGSSDGFVTTHHKVEFQGSAWNVVLEKCYDELYAAFRSSTAKALGLPEEDVFGIIFSIGSLVAHFSIRHSLSFSGKGINHALITNDYTEVWAIYRKEGGKHGIPQLIKADRLLPSTVSHEEIKQNFTDSQSMESKRKTESSHGTTTHHTIEEISNTQLLAQQSLPSSTSSSRIKSFRGELWGTILQDHRDELQRAIERDIAEVTGLTGKLKTQLSLEGGKLIALSTATHDNNEKDPKINQKLEEHDYPHVWKLYNEKRDILIKKFNNGKPRPRRSSKPRVSFQANGSQHSSPTFHGPTRFPETRIKSHGQNLHAAERSNG